MSNFYFYYGQHVTHSLLHMHSYLAPPASDSHTASCPLSRTALCFFSRSMSAGDWQPPSPYDMTNQHLTAAFAFLHDVDLLVGMATLLNLTQDVSTYSQLYTDLAEDFHSTFYNDSLKGYGDGMQASNVLALALPGVVPSNLTASVLQSLVADLKAKGHFTVGMVAMARLFSVLSSNGQHDLAVSVIQQTSYPSYGYQFTNDWENATTLWEVWDAPTTVNGPSYASRSHAMYGSIAAWFYRYLAGIDVNGFEPILIWPRMTADPLLLPRVSAEFVSVAGLISVQYERVSAEEVALNVTVPTNTRARLTLEELLPLSRCVSLTESGRDVFLPRLAGHNSYAVLHTQPVEGIEEVWEEETASGAEHRLHLSLQSGQYTFTAIWKGLMADDRLTSSTPKAEDRLTPASSDPPRLTILTPDPSLPASDPFGSLVAWQPQWGEEDVHWSPAERQMARLREWSKKPLKGWNTCGAFFWSVSEEEMMANIDLTIQLLQPAGYNIIELGQQRCTALQHPTAATLCCAHRWTVLCCA